MAMQMGLLAQKASAGIDGVHVPYRCKGTPKNGKILQAGWLTDPTPINHDTAY